MSKGSTLKSGGRYYIKQLADIFDVGVYFFVLGAEPLDNRILLFIIKLPMPNVGTV